MTATEQLAAKRDALQQAEQAIVTAEKANDVPGLMAAQKAADAFRAAIANLQVEAQRETEVDARKDARALIKTLRQNYEDAVATFAEESAGLDEQLRNLTPLVEALFAKWAALEWRKREVEVVMRRFELPNGKPLSPLPGTPDVALAVFDVAVRSNIRPSPTPVYMHVASMSSEQKHQADVVALAAYVQAHRAKFSPETRALFANLPAPDAPPMTPDQAAKVKKLERQNSEAQRMRQRADAEAAAWTAVRNHDTPEAQQMRAEKIRAVARAEAATRKRMAEEVKLDEQVRRATRGKGPLAGLRE